MPANAKHKITHLWPLLELIAATMDTRQLRVGTTKATSGARLQIYVIAVSKNDKQALSFTDVIITCSQLPQKGYHTHKQPGDAPENCISAI